MMFCTKFGWNWPTVVLKKKKTIFQVYHNDNDFDDDTQRTKLWLKTSLVPSTQVNLKIVILFYFFSLTNLLLDLNYSEYVMIDLTVSWKKIEIS